MNAERLTWDSDFFGFRVGRVVVSEDEASDASDLRKTLEGLDVGLAYVFLPGAAGAAQERNRSVLVSLSGRLVDRKVTFCKRLLPQTDLPKEVMTVVALTPEIEALAYGSGWCSRFAGEDRLRPFFRPLYKRWLQNDLRDGRVLVKTSVAGKPVGLTTVSARDGIGRIGLVAVDVEHCRRGIATELLRAAEDWLLQQGVGECRVVTQHANVAGMALYERCGYAVVGQQEVWHVWKTPDLT